MHEGTASRLDEVLYLYELSAGIGGSLDPVQTCKGFARTLLARRNFSYVAFWVRSEIVIGPGTSACFTLLYSSPKVRSTERRADLDHPALSRAPASGGFSVHHTELHFDALVDELGGAPSVLTMIPLGEIGWIKLLSAERVPPGPREIAQLSDVAGRLANSLFGALAYQRLLGEVEEREQLETRLRHAQKFEAMAQLTGGLAHDFNNILTSIIGFNQLAWLRFGEQGNDELDEYLSEIREASGRAKTLVAKIHAFNRNETAERSGLALGNCVRDALRLLRPMTPSSVEIGFAEQPSLPRVNANCDEVVQIVMNLCLNARDAVDEHGGVSVRLEHLPGQAFECASCLTAVDGDWVSLAVRDEGSGIPPDARPRMFDPFFTTKGERGSGLGLSMVHGLVHAHHGHIRVVSCVDRGTTMEVLLPALGGGAG
jgi:signal transduction histidine kinase